MSRRVHGKYVRIRRKDPRASAMCDYSGFRVMHYNLVKQMEYNASGLYWTGYYVEKRFADIPNQQHLSPYTGADPYPIQHPRPDVAFEGIVPRIQIDVGSSPNFIDGVWEQDTLQSAYLNQTYVGSLTGDLRVVFPVCLAQWTVTNYCQGGFSLSFSQLGSPNSYTVPSGDKITFYGTFTSFSPRVPVQGGLGTLT